MTKVITGVSFFILSVLFTNQASAQIVSSAQEVTDNKTNSNSDIKRDESSSSLAAVVFESSDDKGKLRIHFENYVKGKVSVKLTYSGVVMHKELSQQDLYRRKFDMQNLPLGEYLIEIANENQVYAKKVTIKNENGIRVLSII